MTVEQRSSVSPPPSPSMDLARSASFTFPTNQPATPPSTPYGSSSSSHSPFSSLSLSSTSFSSWFPATWTPTWREAVVTICILAQLLVITQVATWVSPGAPLDPNNPSRLVAEASLSAQNQAALGGEYQGVASLPTGRRALEAVSALEGARLAAARGLPGAYPADGELVHGSRKRLQKRGGVKGKKGEAAVATGWGYTKAAPATAQTWANGEDAADSAMTSAVTSAVVSTLQAGTTGSLLEREVTILDGEQPYFDEEAGSSHKGHVALSQDASADVGDADTAPADVEASQEASNEQSYPSQDTSPKQDQPKQEDQKQEEQKQEEPKAEEQKGGEQKPQEPKAEEPKAEEQKPQEQKQEEQKGEEQKPQEQKAEEPKAEEQKSQEPKAEEPKAEEQKPQEPKAEEQNQEEQKPQEQRARDQPQQEEPKQEQPKNEGSEQQQQQQQDAQATQEGEKQEQSASQGGSSGGEEDKCAGRRVFVYDYLPSKFHQDLITNCSNPCDNFCDNMCPTLEKDGLGAALQEPDNDDGRALFSDSYGGKTYKFGPWLGTQQNMVGVIFRKRMESYECRTSDWEKADAFYIPALFGLKTLYGSQLPFQEIEAMGDELEQFLAYQPGFMRKGGKDHFLVVGQQYNDFMCREKNDPNKDWSWCSYLYYRPALANVTLISVERPFWEQRIQSVPYLTAFHPSSDGELQEWIDFVKDHPRPHKVTLLAGRRSNVPVRQAVLAACEGKADSCRFVDCSGECPRGSCRKVVGVCGEPRLVAKEYLSSTFCLMPNGDSATRRSIFDALIAGCIPVHFDPDAFDRQYPWHHGDPQKVSVLFDKESTQNKTLDFLAALHSISDEKLAEMQRNIIDLIPNLVFRDHTRAPAAPSSEATAVAVSFKDAFDLSVDGILKHLISPVTYPI